MKNAARLALSLFIVGGFIAVIWIVADGFGAWDVYKALQQTRAAEAHTQELEAEANALQAKQSLITTFIMGFASIKDSLLVTVTYILGGALLILALVLIGVLLLERGSYERDIRA